MKKHPTVHLSFEGGKLTLWDTPQPNSAPAVVNIHSNGLVSVISQVPVPTPQKGQAMMSSKAWPYKPLPYNPDAHIITSVGAFKFCRRDKFCRCRKCKPPLTKGE